MLRLLHVLRTFDVSPYVKRFTLCYTLHEAVPISRFRCCVAFSFSVPLNCTTRSLASSDVLFRRFMGVSQRVFYDRQSAVDLCSPI